MKLFMCRQPDNVIPYQKFNELLQKRSKQKTDERTLRMMRNIRRAPEPMHWIIELESKKS